MSHPVTRAELREELATTKAELREELAATRAELREELAKFATKAELREELAKHPTKDELALHLEGWARQILDVSRAERRDEQRELVASLRHELGAELARVVKAANEEMRDWMRAQDDRYRDLPPRVTRLEAKVFAPKRRRTR